jgi:nicotinamidase-related amidase
VSLLVAEDSVLVVVDTQPGFLRKLGPQRADEIVDRIRWLVRLANELGIPVVLTEEEPDRNEGTARAVDAVVPAAAPRHVKPTFGLASCPPIMADLERHGRPTAVLCGLETDVCVAQSAIGLIEAGWHVAVVTDAVASPGDAHDQGLTRMAAAGVELIGLKGLVYEWLRTVAGTDAHDGLLSDPPFGIVL